MINYLADRYMNSLRLFSMNNLEFLIVNFKFPLCATSIFSWLLGQYHLINYYLVISLLSKYLFSVWYSTFTIIILHMWSAYNFWHCLFLSLLGISKYLYRPIKILPCHNHFKFQSLFNIWWNSISYSEYDLIIK